MEINNLGPQAVTFVERLSVCFGVSIIRDLLYTVAYIAHVLAYTSVDSP